MHNSSFTNLGAFACALLCSFASCQKPNDDVYLFSSFQEPSTSGLHFLWSEDGLHWDSVPGVFLQPEVGNDSTYVDAWTGEVKTPMYYPENRVFRDPSIIQDKQGTFHMVWTTQWYGSNGFGYASSKDLIHWSEQQVINVMQNHPTNNVWAPEIFYDNVQDQYMIIWSSQIDPSTYTQADTLGSNACHRMWYCITKDFKTYTDATPYYDPGFNSIDGFLIKKDCNEYVLIVKDNRKPGYSNLFCVFSDSPYGPFHTADNAPEGTTPATTFGRTFSEGPCAIKLDEEWIIYYDQYNPTQEYGAVSTTDFLTFTPIPERISVPKDHKHGTIIKVKRSLLNGLLNRK